VLIVVKAMCAVPMLVLWVTLAEKRGIPAWFWEEANLA
jgi:hypothetical protein